MEPTTAGAALHHDAPKNDICSSPRFDAIGLEVLQSGECPLLGFLIHAPEPARSDILKPRSFLCAPAGISGLGLSFRNLEAIMAERNLSADHVRMWRCVQRYAPEPQRRCRKEIYQRALSDNILCALLSRGSEPS